MVLLTVHLKQFFFFLPSWWHWWGGQTSCLRVSAFLLCIEHHDSCGLTISDNSWVLLTGLSVSFDFSQSYYLSCFFVSMNVGPANLCWFHVLHESATQRPKGEKFVSSILFWRELWVCQAPRVLHSPPAFPVEPGIVLIWQMWKLNLRKIAWLVYIHAAS